MIALADIDHAAVLKGAQVPLVPTTNHEPDRFEWCGDRLVRMTTTGRIYMVPVELLTRYLALDPIDPDVARLLDRRIAEALSDRDLLPPLPNGALCLLRVGSVGGEPCWTIDFTTPRGPGWLVVNHAAIKDIEPTERNIPTARAALIRALYPRAS